MTETRRVHRWTDGLIDFDGRFPTVGAWVESLPTFEGRRPMMTCDGYLNLMRHMLAGGDVPYYSDPAQLLTDALLAHTRETSDLRRTAELATAQAKVYEPAIQRLWSLVYAAHKRKTMRTEDVRAALESGRG